MLTIERCFPGWSDLSIHESSPGTRGASLRLARGAPRYVASQFFPDQQPGAIYRGFRCENLEALSFPDASIDLTSPKTCWSMSFNRPESSLKSLAR